MAKQTYSDAIALLKADHRKVSELFEKFENAREGQKQALAEQICNELKIHTTIEEEISIRPATVGSRRTRSTRPMSSTTAPRC